MSGSNSDSVEGKYEASESVRINDDEVINSMKFPGSLLLSPHHNHIPLSLSFIGKGKLDQGTNEVINTVFLFGCMRQIYDFKRPSSVSPQDIWV